MPYTPHTFIAYVVFRFCEDRVLYGHNQKLESLIVWSLCKYQLLIRFCATLSVLIH